MREDEEIAERCVPCLGHDRQDRSRLLLEDTCIGDILRQEVAFAHPLQSNRSSSPESRPYAQPGSKVSVRELSSVPRVSSTSAPAVA